MAKNWFRVIYCMLCATGAIVYLTLLAIAPKGISFGLICFGLAPMIFFLGTIAYNVLKSYDKTKNAAASYTQLATGALSTLLFIISAISLFAEAGVADIIKNIAAVYAPAEDPSIEMAKWLSLAFVSIAYFGQLIVFGLLPLLKGIQKTLAVTATSTKPETPKQLPPATVTQQLPAPQEKPKRKTATKKEA